MAKPIVFPQPSSSLSPSQPTPEAELCRCRPVTPTAGAAGVCCCVYVFQLYFHLLLLTIYPFRLLFDLSCIAYAVNYSCKSLFNYAVVYKILNVYLC